MGKSENGPDMRDCLHFLHTIEEVYQCHTTLIIDIDGTPDEWSGFVGLVSVPRGVQDLDQRKGVSTRACYPNRNGKTFEAFLYWLVVQHDAEMTRTSMLRQLELA